MLCTNKTSTKVFLLNKKLYNIQKLYKLQEVEIVIYADIERFMEGYNRSIGDNLFVISKNVPFSVGFSWGNDYNKDYFVTDCFKNFLKDVLDVQSKYNIKLSKPMKFITEDELYHSAYNLCQICKKKHCTNKFRVHCHKTGKYRGPACKICNLSYNDHIFRPVVFHNGKGYDFNPRFDEIFIQNKNNRKKGSSLW